MTQFTSTPTPTPTPTPPSPARVRAQGWGFTLARGLAALIFGLLALFSPGVTLTYLVLLFGMFALLDGLSALFFAFGHTSSRSWGWTAVMGFIGVGIGVFTLFSPGFTTLFLLYTIAFWAIFTGALEMVAAYRLRNEIPGAWEWLVGLSGLVSVVFGVLLYAAPGAGALSVITIIGAYALIAGVALVIQAFQMRSRMRSRLKSRNPLSVSH